MRDCGGLGVADRRGPRTGPGNQAKLHVLDANALYRFLTKGPGFEIVLEIAKQANEESEDLLMSAVNWGEVYYTLCRRLGRTKTEELLDIAMALPLEIIPVGKKQAEDAGRIRASYGLPFADSFVAALTGKEGLAVTSDAKDFKKVPWIRTVALPPGKTS